MNRCAAAIHESQGFSNYDIMAEPSAATAESGIALLVQGNACCGGYSVCSHETDIMSGQGIGSTGISQSGYKLQGGNLA